MLQCNYLLADCGLTLKYMDVTLDPFLFCTDWPWTLLSPAPKFCHVYLMALTAVHGADFLALPASSQPSLSKLKSSLLLLFPELSHHVGLPACSLTSVLLGPATIYRCVEFSFCINTRLYLLTCTSEVSVCSQIDLSVPALTYRVNLLPNPSQCILSASCINHVLILTHFSPGLNIWSLFLPCRK